MGFGLRSVLSSAVLAIAAPLPACSGGPVGAGDGEPTASSAAPIIGGTASTSADDAVVMVENLVDGAGAGSAGYECTGTLLAPNLVVTARHCVSLLVDSSQPFACDRDGNVAKGSATLGPDVAPAHLGIRVGAARMSDATPAAAHGVQILHDDGTVLCNHDLALVVLDTKIPDAKIVPVRLDDTAAPGEAFTAVGWGVTETTDNPPTRMRRAGVRVIGVGPGADSVLQVEIGSHELLTGEVTCEGDSGGPALDATSGALIGVLSRGGNGSSATTIAGQCTGSQTANFFTEPAPFKDLILAGYAAAGADPWKEGDPGPAPIAAAGPTVTGASNGGCATGSGERGGAGTFLAAFALLAAGVARRRSPR